MSHYAEYIKERTTDHILETEYGFATYRYLGTDQVYIIDIFVAPDARCERHASHMADRIATEAKERGCTEMLGTVVPTTKNSTISIKVLLGYGMELKSANDNLIIFRKGL